jgi:hypothetical protein
MGGRRMPHRDIQRILIKLSVEHPEYFAVLGSIIESDGDSNRFNGIGLSQSVRNHPMVRWVNRTFYFRSGIYKGKDAVFFDEDEDEDEDGVMQRRHAPRRAPTSDGSSRCCPRTGRGAPRTSCACCSSRATSAARRGRRPRKRAGAG